MFSLFFNFFNSSFVIIKNLLLSFGRIFGLNLNPPVVKFSKIHGKDFLIIERKTVPPIIETPLLNKKFTREDFPLILAVEECRNLNSFNSITEKKKAIKALLTEITSLENKMNLIIKDNKALNLHHVGLLNFYNQYFAHLTEEWEEDTLLNLIKENHKKKILANYTNLEGAYLFKKVLEFYSNAIESDLKVLEKNHYQQVKAKIKDFSLLFFTTFTLKKIEYNKKNLIIFLRIVSLALSIGLFYHPTPLGIELWDFLKDLFEINGK